MSAARSAKRPPAFTTYTECEVEVEASELEREGWVYVGKDKGHVGPSSVEQVVDIVRDWHDETHDGPWQWCHLGPCDSVRGRDVP